MTRNEGSLDRDTVLRELHGWADQVVCLARPQFFGSVGQYYGDFHQLRDDEVIAALQAAHDALSS